MNEAQLRCFISVQNHLNFTKAAAECHVVQATISRQIAALEEELGCRLFVRDSHGVHPTPAGNALATYAPVLLEYHKTIADRVRNSAGEERVSLRIGIGPCEALLIRPILRRMKETLPGVNVDLTTYTYRVLMTRYRSNVLDLALCNGLCAGEMPDLVPLKLYEQPWQVAALENSPIWRKEGTDVQRLKEQTIITLGNDAFDSVRAYCLEYGLGQKMIETNFLTTQLELVGAGLGVAILPPFVKDQLPPGVVMADILSTPYTMPFYAMLSPVRSALLSQLIASYVQVSV